MLSDLQSQAVEVWAERRWRRRERDEWPQGGGKRVEARLQELLSLPVTHSWVRDKLEEGVWKQVAGEVPWCSELFSRTCIDSLGDSDSVQFFHPSKPRGAQDGVLQALVSTAWGAAAPHMGREPHLFSRSSLCTRCRPVWGWGEAGTTYQNLVRSEAAFERSGVADTALVHPLSIPLKIDGETIIPVCRVPNLLDLYIPRL